VARFFLVRIGRRDRGRELTVASLKESSSFCHSPEIAELVDGHSHCEKRECIRRRWSKNILAKLIVVKAAMWRRLQAISGSPHGLHEATRRDRSPATTFLTTQRDMCDSAMPPSLLTVLTSAFCQIRQKHKTEAATCDSQG
jgi:hypothetical protein